ncbi:hypothetical protein ABIE45_003648 [Methylobacterium sp. OAE515]|jgi:hypothetical protein
MTAPQVVATIFFIISIGSVSALVLMAAAAAMLDALDAACGPRQSGGRSVGLGSPSHWACRMRQRALARIDLR